MTHLISKIKYLLLAFSLISLDVCAQSHVMINEILQTNVDELMVKQDFPDSWIELYNPSSGAVSVTGWHIGLTNDFEHSWYFRNSMTIFGHDYLMVYCDKQDNGYQHTDFRLDADKCTLYLWDSNGNLVDSLAYPKMLEPNIAYGRTEDGGANWNWEVTATPGAANSGVFTDQILPDPEFSLEGGVFTPSNPLSADELTVSFPNTEDTLPSDTRLYVTTDGSMPTFESQSYGWGDTCNIPLNQTVVVRARLLSTQALAALPVTESYIIHPRELTLPVFSFSTNDKFLYDPEIGMLLGTDGSGNCYKGWRRPFNIEFFDSTDYQKSMINQVGEAGMHGAGSMSHNQKSMNVYTSKHWQKKRFKSSTFWPDKPQITKTKTFCVRNGGSRCLDSRFEDAFVQLLFAQHIDSLEYLDYSPCILYINGQYKGLYGLRERANNTWPDNNLGISEDSVIEVESFYEDSEVYYPIKQLIWSDEGTYADYCRYFDMPLLLNYLCCEAFGTNTLFPSTNVFMWRRAEGEDTRLHPVLKDLDQFADEANSTNWYNFITLTGTEGTWGGSTPCRKIFVRLFAMPEFLNAFVERMQVYLGDFCKPSVTVPMVNRMRAEIESEVAPTFETMDEAGTTYDDFARRIEQKLIPYCQQRPMIHYQHITDRFKLGNVIPMQVQNDSPTSVVWMNGIKLTEGNFDGACFSGMNTKLDTGSPDLGWRCAETHSDGSIATRYFDSQVINYRPDSTLTSVSFTFFSRQADHSSVQIIYTEDEVTCTNPFVAEGVDISIADHAVTITSQATDTIDYHIVGQASNASLNIVSNQPWHLYLDGISLKGRNGAIITSQGNASGIISLTENTQNQLTNVALLEDRENPHAAIYSEGNLTFEGLGNLAINTSGKTGCCIVTEGSLTFDDGNYTFVNKSNGSKEYGAIYAGIVLQSAEDMTLKNGTFDIQASGVATRCAIAGGKLTLGDANDSSMGPQCDIKSLGSTLYTGSDNGTITSGCPVFRSQDELNVYGNTSINARAVDNDCNALKSFTRVNIWGGNLYLHCYDDCINCPGQICFYGGNTVCFSTDDDAIDSDYGQPGAILLAGGNLFTYTLDVATEEGLDCDDDERIFITGGIVISAGGAQHPESRLTGGSTQGYYMGPGFSDCDPLYYYTLCNNEGESICTFRFESAFANRFSLFTAPNMGRGSFHVVYGTEPPSDYTESVGDCFFIGGTTSNTARYDFNANNPHALTLGLMGASATVRDESAICKDDWSNQLDLEIRNYGISGAGFCNTTQNPGMQEEVTTLCAPQRPDYDVYLLWSPSNDFKERATIGTISDYTEADNYNEAKLATFYGGMNYCLRKLREKDPDGLILLFTTLPRFDKGSIGYDASSTDTYAMRRYVDAEIDWANHNQIPYLDLFRQSGITGKNYKQYLQDDNVHLNEAGYTLIQPLTTEFLRNQMQQHSAIEDVNEDNASNGTPIEIYSLTGQRLLHPSQKGIHVIRYSNGMSRKVFE